MTITDSVETEDHEYRPLGKIKYNYPKYLLTYSGPLQKRSGIHHIQMAPFMRDGSEF